MQVISKREIWEACSKRIRCTTVPLFTIVLSIDNTSRSLGQQNFQGFRFVTVVVRLSCVVCPSLSLFLRHVCLSSTGLLQQWFICVRIRWLKHYILVRHITPVVIPWLVQVQVLETWIFLIFSMQSRAFLVDITIQILKVHEYMYRWKQHKHVQARGRGAWASLAHALQCLCERRACCPARALQLVICRSWGFTGAVTLLLQLVIIHWDSTGWCEN